MNRHQPVDDKTLLDKFVEEAAGIVSKYCKYAVVSGFVAIASGRSRGTEDIDMIIERVPKEVFRRMHADFEKAGFEALQSASADKLYDMYLRQKTSIRYVKEGTYVPELELMFAKDRLDDDQLENRVKLPLTGLDVYFSSVETNIAFKEEMLKSDKDMEDARHLRMVYSDDIDEDEINRIKGLIKALRKT